MFEIGRITINNYPMPTLYNTLLTLGPLSYKIFVKLKSQHISVSRLKAYFTFKKWLYKCQ